MVSLVFVLIAPQVFAGGGPFRLVNYSNGQVINADSYEFVLQIDDFSSYPSKPAPGKEVVFEAHHDLDGAYCETTQAVSDSEGRVKGKCGTAEHGRFVFTVKLKDGSRQTESNVYLTGPSSRPTPVSSPISQPVATVKPVATVQPVVVASPMATPLKSEIKIEKIAEVEEVKIEATESQQTENINLPSDRLEPSPNFFQKVKIFLVNLFSFWR